MAWHLTMIFFRQLGSPPRWERGEKSPLHKFPIRPHKIAARPKHKKLLQLKRTFSERSRKRGAKNRKHNPLQQFSCNNFFAETQHFGCIVGTERFKAENTHAKWLPSCAFLELLDIRPNWGSIKICWPRPQRKPVLRCRSSIPDLFETICVAIWSDDDSPSHKIYNFFFLHFLLFTYSKCECRVYIGCRNVVI